MHLRGRPAGGEAQGMLLCIRFRIDINLGPTERVVLRADQAFRRWIIATIPSMHGDTVSKTQQAALA